MRSTVVKALVICVVVGCLGGAIGASVGLASPLTGTVLGGVYGILFALLISSLATTPGAGLLWGLAYALLLWLANSAGLFSTMVESAKPDLLHVAQDQFPALVTYLLCFGMP